MTVVVVGGGQAGFQTVASLRDDGYTGAIVLIGDQHLPYQRPPLSKAYLKSPITIDQLHYRPQDFYDRHAITVRQGPAVGIDRTAHTVTLADREHIAYDHLVLATGCRVHKASVPGEQLRGVHYLRDHADAERLVDAQRLLGVESVNRPADHLAARRLLAAPDKLADLTPDKVRYPGFTLRAHLAG